MKTSCAWPPSAVATLLTLAAIVSPLHAQPPANQQLKNLSLEQLGNIEVVSQSKEPEAVWKIDAAIYVLTAEDIRRAGVTNIPDALRLVPGVEVARVNGDRNWVVAIRGFGNQFSRNVLVLLDGRSVYTPLFAGVLWPIQNVVIEDIDRIEVIRGPGGTIWGANAVNGVINIITKASSETQGGLVAVGGGNVDQGTGAFRYGSHVGTAFTYKVNALAYNRAPEFHTDGKNYDDSRLGQVGFRIDRNAGRDELTLQGDAYKAEFGDAQSISNSVPPFPFISFQPYYATGGNVLGRWRRRVSDRSDFYLQAYWSRDYRKGSNLGEVRDQIDVDFLHRISLNAHNLFTYGGEIRLSPSTYFQTATFSDFQPHNRTDQIYSAFLQDEFHFLPDTLHFTVGSKLEHNNYTGFEYQPNARLLFTPSPHQSLWASVSRAVRTPSRVDTDIKVDIAVPNPNPGQPPFVAEIIGDPHINSEALLSYELGYRTLLKPSFYFDIAAFHNIYHDLIAQGSPVISLIPSPPEILVQFKFRNGIEGNTDGVEIAPNYRPTRWWQMKGSYSYLHFDLRDHPGFTDTTTLNIFRGSSPSHQVVFQSQFDLPKHFEFDPVYRYVSRLPAQQVRAYNTMDARAGWRWGNNFAFSVTGQNLLQPHHAEFGIDPGPTVLIKRSIYAKIIWTR